MKPKTIAILTIVLLFLVILLQNTQVVTLKILFWQISMSQIILIPLTMLIGFILGYFAAKVSGSQSRKGGEDKTA